MDTPLAPGYAAHPQNPARCVPVAVTATVRYQQVTCYWDLDHLAPAPEFPLEGLRGQEIRKEDALVLHHVFGMLRTAVAGEVAG